MLKEWFRANFCHIHFKVGHVEHLSYEDVVRYTSQRFYNERMHNAFYLAVKEYFESDCRYSGIPYGEHVFGEIKNAFNPFKYYKSFERNHDAAKLMAALNYIREYPESNAGFILADKLIALVNLQPKGWISYFDTYSIATAGVYVNRLFTEISTKVEDDTEYHRVHLELMELFETESKNPLLPQMLHSAIAPCKDLNLKELQNAKG